MSADLEVGRVDAPAARRARRPPRARSARGAARRPTGRSATSSASGAGAAAQPAARLGERAGGDHAVERQQQAGGLAAERERHAERERAEREQPEQRRAGGSSSAARTPSATSAGRRAAREHGRAAGQLVAGERRDGERRRSRARRASPRARRRGSRGQQHGGRGGRRGEHRRALEHRRHREDHEHGGHRIPTAASARRYRRRAMTPRARRLAPAAATSAVVAVAARPASTGRGSSTTTPATRCCGRSDLAQRPHAASTRRDFAPTPHPLQTAFSLLALPFGDAADDVLTFATLLAFGALVYLAFALGAELFSPWVGVVAALVVLTRPALERDALLAYQDVPFAALVVGAVLLEARRPRRGRAGAGAARRRRAAAPGGVGARRACTCSGSGAAATTRERAVAVALAAAAPLIWAASDWVVTGDPLHSLHGTADLAIANDRRRSRLRGAVLDRAVLRLRAARAARGRRPDRARVRVALRAPPARCCRSRSWSAMVAVFAVGPIFGLPLIRRYIAHAGRAADAVLRARRGRLGDAPAAAAARTRWLAAGVVAALLSVAYLPWHVDLLATVERRLRPRRRALRRPAAGDARRRRCAPRSPPARTSRPPTTGRSRTCASGSTATPARSRRSRAARARWASCC